MSRFSGVVPIEVRAASVGSGLTIDMRRDLERTPNLHMLRTGEAILDTGSSSLSPRGMEMNAFSVALLSTQDNLGSQFTDRSLYGTSRNVFIKLDSGVGSESIISIGAMDTWIGAAESVPKDPLPQLRINPAVGKKGIVIIRKDSTYSSPSFSEADLRRGFTLYAEDGAYPLWKAGPGEYKPAKIVDVESRRAYHVTSSIG